MFRPCSGEEGVDVSVITQLLVPILERRTADGSFVFKAFGDSHRKTRDPDEAIIFCVDLSASMKERCGFADVEENEDLSNMARRSRAYPSADDIMRNAGEDMGNERLTLDELQEFLLAHESFDDFLAIIIACRTSTQKYANARKVLKILRQLDEQLIVSKSKELENARNRGSSYHFRMVATDLQRDLTALINRCQRMDRFNDSLCEFLVYRADNAGVLPDIMPWSLGQPVPRVSRQNVYQGPIFDLPHELLCPISGEIMEDPVKTSDGFTYDRKNIERWFHRNSTSPLTNVVLTDLDLQPDFPIKERIVRFVEAHDIIARSPTGSRTQTVTLKSPFQSWTLHLPKQMTLHNLYEVAFRASKGRTSKFELYHRNAKLPASQNTISDTVTSVHDVIIRNPSLDVNETTDGDAEDLCLVKVYCSSHNETQCSYWERKNTIKTFASVLFRYYRMKLTKNISSSIEEPFVIWRNLVDIGDGFRNGYNEMHWASLSRFFHRTYATGVLSQEPMTDKNNVGDDTRDRDMAPLVLKLELGQKSRSTRQLNSTLKRLDVLKQMFEAFMNRLLAYNFQTHVGLVTFGTSINVAQGLTHAVENFRHELNSMKAEGDTAIWDSKYLHSF